MKRSVLDGFVPGCNRLQFSMFRGRQFLQYIPPKPMKVWNKILDHMQLRNELYLEDRHLQKKRRRKIKKCKAWLRSSDGPCKTLKQIR